MYSVKHQVALAVSAVEVPANADSLGAKLSQGADGIIVLSWIERGSDSDALRFSRYDSGGWGNPTTVVRGEDWFVNWADFPSVVAISPTFWGAHWLVRREAGGYAYDAYGAVSTDAGATWSDGAALHSDGTDTEHGFVTLFPQEDGMGAIWLDGRKMVNDVGPDPTGSGMTLRAATFTNDDERYNEQLVDDLICDCCQTDVAMTSLGPVAVYRDRTPDEVRDIYVTRLVDGAWQPGTPVSNDNWNIAGCPVNGPVINAVGSSVAVTWFTAAEGTPRVRLAASTNAGQTFSAPVEVVTGDTLGRVSAALIDADTAVAAWLSTSANGAAQLMLRRVSLDGALGPTHTISDAVEAFSVPQMTINGDRLLLAWTGKVDKSSQIQSASISLASLLN